MHLTAFQNDAQKEETSVQLSVSTAVPRSDQSEWCLLIPIALTNSAIQMRWVCQAILLSIWRLVSDFTFNIENFLHKSVLNQTNCYVFKSSVLYEFLAAVLIHFLLLCWESCFPAVVDLLKHTYISVTADPFGFSVWGVGLQPLACRGRWFESRQGRRCLSVVNVVCCQAQVSVTIWTKTSRSAWIRIAILICTSAQLFLLHKVKCRLRVSTNK